MRYPFHLIALALFLSGCESQQPAAPGTVDWLTRSIAIFGAVIAVCGLLLGIRNYFWDKAKFEALRQERLEDKAEKKREKEEEAKTKAEQSRERVTTQLYLGSTLDGKPVYTHQCKVRLYNPCAFTIPIKHVWLDFLDLEKTEKQGKRVTTVIPLYAELTADMPTAGPTGGSLKVRLGSATNFDLESRKEVFFSCILEESAITLISRINTEDDVYISIISTAGEIERIKSNEILPGIKQMLNPPA